MRKQFYFGLSLIVSFILCYACQKQHTNDVLVYDKEKIVLDLNDSTSNNSDIKALVQSGLDSFHQQEILKTIDSIVSKRTLTNQYILVYYHSNQGNSNILFKGDYQDDQIFASTTTKCEGSCDCKVQVTYDKDVNISCTCTSCAMVITQTALADFKQLQALCNGNNN